MHTTIPTATSEWLDGPGLCEWIDEEEGGELQNADARLLSHARKVRDWRAGGRASVYTADLVLTKLGLHLGMLPEHLYV